MKILITGGVKSGKSLNAEKRILEISKIDIPIYLATCEIFDNEMVSRIQEHRKRRGKKFKTIEEPLNLFEVVRNKKNPILIECITMWLNNALQHKISNEKIFSEIENLLSLKNDVIFVMNEVGFGIIPNNPLARKFSDLSGKISQKISKSCDEVNFSVAGILMKLK